MGLLRDLYRRFRRARCPVDPEKKAWIEARLLWLRDQFGSGPLRREPLTPSSEYLPTSWDGSEDACLELVDGLCEFMDIPRDCLEVELYDGEENPLTTDLLTVFSGAGIFSANAAFQFGQWHDAVARMQGWSTRRVGYLSEQEYGYALACYARLRGEARPAWAAFLEPNIRHYFDESVDFLRRDGQTVVPFGG